MRKGKQQTVFGLVVGNEIRFLKPHPMAGELGRVKGFANTPWGIRPIIEVLEMCGHEVFVLREAEIKKI